MKERVSAGEMVAEQKQGLSPLPRAVIALGWVSLFTDAASDMIYPLVPAFLLSIGAGAEALGWLEGIAEAVAAGVKIVSGRASDRSARRKPLIAMGYGISALARPLFALVTLPAQAVAIRAIDRVGKGMRGPPRDAMIAGVTEAPMRGRAFGFHRMMDNLGGVMGPLLAAALLRLVELPLRWIFALSIIPGLCAVLIVLVFVRDPARIAHEGEPEADRQESKPRSTPLSSGARRYLGALLLFSLAGSGDLFLLRRLSDLGLAVALVPVAWISLQLVKALLNVPGGRASDRFGRRPVLMLAWLLYALTYLGFGLVGSWVGAWLMLGVYALHYGLAEGGQRALLAEFVPEGSRGRAFGIQLAIEGAMVLPANVLFGMIYERVSAKAAFSIAATVALLATIALAWVPRPAAAASPSS